MELIKWKAAPGGKVKDYPVSKLVSNLQAPCLAHTEHMGVLSSHGLVSSYISPYISGNLEYSL